MVNQVSSSRGLVLLTLIFMFSSVDAAPLLPFLHGQAGKPETAYWLYAGVNVVVGIIFAYLIIRDKKKNAA